MKLSERLEALLALAECTEDAERDHTAPDAECVFVDVRPDVFDASLREAAELARRVEDAAVAHVEWDGGADLTVYFDGCPDEDLKGCRWNAIMSEKLDGQRVRIVPEQGEG